MTLLDDPVPSFELEPPTPRGVLARAVPVVVVFALLGLIGTAGTWASFTASTDNPTTLATGSLVLANTVTGGSGTCESDDDAGLAVNSSTCDVFFDVAPQQPGHAPVEATLTLKNVGTVDASALSAHAEGACTSPLVGAYNGSVSLCTKLQLTVQEYGDAGFTTESNCIYGDGDGTTCQFAPTMTVDDFVATHGGFATGAPIGDLAVDAERYFRISVQLEDELDNNSVQGREATFSLAWRAEQ